MTVFHKEMTIIEALQRHEGAASVFGRYGMTCSACMSASSSTIATGAVMHGVDPEELVQALNELELQQA